MLGLVGPKFFPLKSHYDRAGIMPKSKPRIDRLYHKLERVFTRSITFMVGEKKVPS